MGPFRWGIFGTGTISAKFAAGLAAARNSQVSFVASRSLAKAQSFAGAMGIPRAIEGYAEAAATGGADAIYIATPPSEHARHALLCIEAGVPVLVEKPFASTVADALCVVEAARTHSVFAMEAMWTRFLPAAQALKEQMNAGVVGEIRMLSGNFGTAKIVDPANGGFDPARGGGAMAQLGVYPLSLAQWLFGTPVGMQATGTMGDTGVEEDAAFQLRYAGGAIGSFYASIRAWAPNDFHVMGTNGIIAFHGPIFRPNGLKVSRQAPLRFGQPNFGWRMRFRERGLYQRLVQISGLSRGIRGKSINLPYAGNGYHYEADEVRNCVERGMRESAIMPLSDSLEVARTTDNIREAILANVG